MNDGSTGSPALGRLHEDVRKHAMEILDAIGHAVIATDLAGSMIYWSPAAQALYGWSPDEALGRSVLDLTPADATHAEASDVMQELARGKPWAGEMELRRKDGTVFTAQVTNSIIRDEAGDPVGIVGVSCDVTERNRSEFDLRERVKELGLLIDAGRILAADTVPEAARLQNLVDAVPDAWLHPESTEARIRLENLSFQTSGWTGEGEAISAPIVSEDEPMGDISVERTDEPDAHAAFIVEERELLDALAIKIAHATKRSRLARQLARTVDALEEAVFVVDPLADRSILAANRAASEIFGYAPGELLGRSTRFLHLSEDAWERFGRTSEPLLARSGVFHGTFDMRRSDGSVFPAEQSVSLLDPELGLEGGVVSVIRDLSAVHYARSKLVHSERRFETIANHLEDVLWIARPQDDHIEYVSPAYRVVWGRDPREVMEDPALWFDHAHPDDVERLRRLDVFANPVDRDVEYRIVRPDGEVRWIHDRTFTVKSDDGSVEQLIGIAADVTDRRRAEERLGAVAREISDAMYVLDADGKVRYATPSIERTTGYGLEEFQGGDALQKVHPEDRERVSAALAEVAATPDGATRIEYRFMDAHGRTLTVESLARNLLDTPGIDGVLVTTRNVTEQRELEARVRQMQRMDSIGRLAGGVAHDFNNILTVIRSQTDLILLQELEGPVADDVTVIQQAADRAARLTRQLLALSREQVLQPRLVDLGEIVGDASELIARLIGEQVDVEYRVERHLPTVRVDPSQVEQVVMNLAINARDAMPDGGTISIAVYPRTVDAATAAPIPDLDPGPYVVVAVTDTGTGMTPEVKDRIFEPFFTTKPTGRGTGLGLSMAYGTVRQSGGSIQVRTREGHGTSFLLHFPAVSATGTDAPTERSQGGPGQPLQGRVLVVEDDPQVRQAAVRVLSHFALDVEHVGSVEEAFMRLESAEFDVVLTDLMLGSRSGYELLDRVRSGSPNTSVIVMSGYAEGSAGRRDLPPGVPFVEKPFTPAALMNAVREAL